MPRRLGLVVSATVLFLSPGLSSQPTGPPYSPADALRTLRLADVPEVSKTTTLPIGREIVEAYVTRAQKLPWYIDLLNINLNCVDLAKAKRRIGMLTEAFEKSGQRVTGNLDF